MKFLGCIFLSAFFLGFFAGQTFARQSDFALYQTDLYSVNPAAGGTNNYLSVKLLHRNSWQVFPGAPKAYRLSIHSALLSRRGAKMYVPERHHTLGISAQAESAGSFARTNTSFSYGYHLSLKKNLRSELRAGFAASVGLVSVGLNAEEVRTLQAGDPAVGRFGETVWSPDGNLGFWLYSEQFYAGFSVQNLSGGLSGNTAQSGRERTFLAHFGFMQLFPDRLTAFIPSLMLQYSETVLRLNVSGKLQFSDKAWLGGDWRMGSGASVFAGFNLRQFLDFTYAYDISSTEIRKFAGSTHELALGLKVGNYRHRSNKRPKPVLFD